MPYDPTMHTTIIPSSRGLYRAALMAYDAQFDNWSPRITKPPMTQTKAMDAAIALAKIFNVEFKP